MEHGEDFYTMKGYSLQESGAVTSAMEDYLEMITRLSREGGRVRVGDLSRRLHVRASSATKMVQQLDRAGLLRAQRYGHIALTQAGQALGDYLMYRHEVIHAFLRRLNHTDNELEQVEKIEHFLDPPTVRNLERLTRRMEQDREEPQG